ncbi:MAG: GNAT family N-acetyltransferase, partial [Candidatus Dormiibacterota bacterium]
ALLVDDELGAGREDLRDLDTYQEAFRVLDATPNQLLAVAELDSAVVGTLQLSFLPGLSRRGAWRAQVEAVRVAGPLRGQSIGREMMDWAIAEARAHGCTLVQLTSHHTRERAHRFYERLGFEASHVGMKLPLG